MKILITTLSVSAMICFSAAFAVAAPYYGWTEDYSGNEPGTLLLWKFDGNYTPDEADSAALADSSPNNRRVQAPTGTAVSVGNSVTGKWGGGFRLGDADGGLASSKLVGTSASTSALGTVATSVEFWFQPLTLSLNSSYLADKKYTSNNGASLRFAASGTNRLVAEVGNGSASLQVISGNLDFALDEWYHIALTYTADTGTLSLFLNGILLGSTVNASFGELTPGNPVWSLGNRVSSVYNSAPGIYDNFRVSDVAYDYAVPVPEPLTVTFTSIISVFAFGVLLRRKARGGAGR